MSIGQRISELRKQKGFSQEYVAERLDVSRQAVSKWETDISAPDTYNLIALAELFEVSVEYIATGKGYNQASGGLKKAVSLMTNQERAGFMLLGMGLIAIILGLLFSDVLIFISVALIIAGIICVNAPKKQWLVAMWGCFIIVFLAVKLINLQIFLASIKTEKYEASIRFMTIAPIINWICAAACIAVSVIITVKFVLKKYKAKDNS